MNANVVQNTPEFFRLPSRGSDPWFGLTRSFYYQLEKAGELRLVRKRAPGKLRGVTLVAAVDARRVLEKAQREATA